MLRIADCLRSQFRLELEAHKAFFADLRRKLRKTSFIALWGNRLALGANGEWRLLAGDEAPIAGNVLLVELDTHLAILRDGFALPDPALAEGQFDLFSLPNLHKRKGRMQIAEATNTPRRRSA